MVARLVITADDAGALPAIDDAVIDLLERGTITRAAVFPNGPTFGSFISRVRDRSSVLPHLTLTYGCPLGPALGVETLLNDRGQFMQPLNFYSGDIEAAIGEWCKRCYSIADLAAAEREIARQLTHYRAAVPESGHDVTFHHDIDEVVLRSHPEVAIKAFGYGRTAARRSKHVAGHICRFLEDDTSQSEAGVQAVDLIEAGIRLSEGAGGLPAEVIFHPSAQAATLSAFTAYTVGRVSEYYALLSDDVASVLRRAQRSGSLLEFA